MSQSTVLIVDKLKSIYGNTRNMLCSPNEHIEIEARYTTQYFYDILAWYQDNIQHTKHRSYEDTYKFHNEKNVVLRRYSDDTYMLKRQISSVTCNSVKIAMSSETTMNAKDMLTGKLSNPILSGRRNKVRYEFKRCGYVIHFTTVNELDDNIEFELDTGDSINFDSLASDIERVTSWKSHTHPSMLSHINSKSIKMSNGRLTWPKPCDMTLATFRKHPHLTSQSYITTKLDGVRSMIFMHYGTVYAVNGKGQHMRICSSYADDGIHILDAERGNDSDDVYTVFDILVYNGKDLTMDSNMDIKARHDILNRLPEAVFMRIKPVIECSSYSDMVSIVSNAHSNKHMYDGVIFYKPNTPYSDQSTVFKYKFNHTVDVQIKHNTPYLYSKNSLVKLNCKLLNMHSNTGSTNTGRLSVSSIDTKGVNTNEPYIAEFKYDSTKDALVYYRMRYDKSHPNSIAVYNNIVNMYRTGDNIPLDMMTGKLSTPFFMQIIHNKYKSSIVSNLKGNLLDIGSGKGGDVNKWVLNKQIRSVTCIEPDSRNYAELVSRVRKKSSKLRINTICKKFMQYDTNDKYDCVTVFFVLNCIEPSQLDEFMSKVYSITTDDPTIVIMFMDGSKVHNAQSSSYSISNYDGHTYSISLHNTIVSDHSEYVLTKKSLLAAARKAKLNTKGNGAIVNLTSTWLSTDESILTSMYKMITLHKV